MLHCIGDSFVIVDESHNWWKTCQNAERWCFCESFRFIFYAACEPREINASRLHVAHVSQFAHCCSLYCVEWMSKNTRLLFTVSSHHSCLQLVSFHCLLMHNLCAEHSIWGLQFWGGQIIGTFQSGLPYHDTILLWRFANYDDKTIFGSGRIRQYNLHF